MQNWFHISCYLLFVFRLNFGNFFIQYSGFVSMFLATKRTRKVSIIWIFLVEVHNLLGTTYKFENRKHSKMFRWFCVEPSKYVWYYCYDLVFRRFHCKFVSKKELEKVFQVFRIICVTEVQFLLIERSQTSHTIGWLNISKIQSFSCYFPEGTRSKTGVPKAFSQTGLKFLCKMLPRHTWFQ
jgi:1-acyl-sn-glycerol-3-phosphate acyltransferase